MKKHIFALVFALLPCIALAAPVGYPLEKANVDLRDKAALQDGLRTFVNFCMGCHSAQYQRYERVATDLGIPEEVMMENVVFTDGTLIGEHMRIGMRERDAKQFFGAAPPDLTMVARVRGEDWLYTYMKTFYEDQSRPFGANNLVFPNVGMPNVLAELQGRVVMGCAPVEVRDGRKVQRDPLTGDALKEEQCDVLTVVEEGAMSAEEFDTTVRNLVSFLAYSADPIKLERHRIGIYVLLYLAFLFVFAYLLKREYWRDVH